MYNQVKEKGRILADNWDDFVFFEGKARFEYPDLSAELVERKVGALAPKAAPLIEAQIERLRRQRPIDRGRVEPLSKRLTTGVERVVNRIEARLCRILGEMIEGDGRARQVVEQRP